jgi:tRNA modification GTPase
LDIDGLPVIVADTAGIRETDDLVESIGIERARQTIENSDVSLCVLSLPDILDPTNGEIQLPPNIQALATPSTIFLLNKSDLLPHASKSLPAWNTGSLVTDEGIPEFMTKFSQILHERYQFESSGDENNAPLITHSRQRVHLETALQFIDAFLQTCKSFLESGKNLARSD